MSTELIVERRSPLPVSPDEAFAWHARPGAPESLVPPWIGIEVLEHTGQGLAPGSRTRFRARPCGLHGFTAEHEHADVEPGRGFTDIQVEGPFDRWMHTHRFEPDPEHPGRSVVHDRIVCELPLGLRLGRRRVRHELIRILAYRHAVTAADLAMHARAPRPLHVGVTGASGFIGSLLVPVLTTGGHRVTRLVRRPAGEGEIQWGRERGRGGGSGEFELEPRLLRGMDAIVHLAGENIARGWTEARKREIRESRSRGTRVLAGAMGRALDHDGPRVLVSASAIGIYGDRGEETLTEASPAGTGFLPEVAKEWEQATEPAEAAGIRVVRLRIGLPLSPAGGLLQRMLPPFRLGVGGKLGSGKQWMSWISADDLGEVFHLALTRETVRGPVNTVGPEPVRNADFTRAVGRALGRPTVLPVPSVALRVLFGEMADQAILASLRVTPYVLRGMGHRYRHETLEAALKHVLGVTSADYPEDAI